ncbi:MAG: hypothetical protein GY946_10370 [bacterium]|nr:hypothetical protein [bacterium]
MDSIPAFIDQLEVPDRPPSEVKRLSELASAFMTAALMAAVRDLMAPFRSSNPTWIRMPASFRNKLAPSRGAIAHQLGERCRYLSQRLQVERLADSLDIQIHCDSALDLTADGVWGGCLTSPPYATRIDYVRSSSPELAVLGIGLDEQADLRSKMTGTPVVRGKGREHTSSSRTAQALLAEIKEHGSHGSANYYQPWLLNYFHELEVGLTNAARSVSRDGRLAVVVQDSYYKELHVDLQTVTIELLEVSGRELVHREDFRAPHLISNMNSHARRHRATRRHHETLLVVE